MLVPYLPPEIIALIIDHLPYYSQYVRTCSLVARSWTTIAQRHAFGIMTFYYNRPDLDPNSTMHKKMCRMIKVLRIVNEKTLHNWDPSFRELFPCLRVLEFVACDLSICNLQTAGIPHFPSTQLEELVLANCQVSSIADVKASILCHLSNVRVIKLRGNRTRGAESSFVFNVAPTPFIAAKSKPVLIIQSPFLDSTYEKACMTIPGLMVRHLSLLATVPKATDQWHLCHMSRINEVVSLCGATLEQLSVQTFGFTDEDDLDLSACQRLESIVCYCPSPDESGINFATLWAMETLRTLPTKREQTVRVTLAFYFLEFSTSSDPANIDLTPFFDFIQSKPNIELQVFVREVSKFAWCEPDTGRREEFLKQWFKPLHASGKVSYVNVQDELHFLKHVI